MTDITDRLRAAVPKLDGIPMAWRCEVRSELLLEAASEVERLREIISTLEIVGKAADDERARPQKEIERLHKAHEAACRGGELLRGEVERLRAELDAMKAGFEVAWRAIGAKP